MESALAPKKLTAQDAALREEFGPVLRWFADRYFGAVRFSPDSEGELRALHAKGFVVHVLRTTAWVNYLYLTWALLRRELPPIRAVVNLRRWFTKPWSLAAQRGDPDVRFTYARRHGGSALIFLRRTALVRPHGKEMKEDPFPALVAQARKSDRPVFLVPELFVWERWTAGLKPRLMDYVFGSPDAPGFLHSVLAFWRNHKSAQFRLGEPIDLQRFVQENPGDSDEHIARKVRGVLNLHLGRETRAVFGPPHKPAERVIEETLRDRALRKCIEEVAQSTQRPPASVERYARKNLNNIASRLHPTMVAALDPLLAALFQRIYDGIEVDETGLSRAMGNKLRAPLVLCPSHKSHIDYLVLSWVLWRRGYSVPHVAAGANLSFFPLGFILRRAGAFFMRRSFKGDLVYTAAFKAYVKRLVHEGVHQEFFPEGGRSRTGKLLPPKFGLLTWEVEAALEGARHDLTFVPVSIDYERVVEGNSYKQELAGGEKKAEDIKGLLKTSKVLASNYGRIHLTFDEPVSLAAFMASRGLDPDRPVSEDEKRGLVRALGHRIMYGISRVSTVTPHALLSASLLAHRARGISAEDLSGRIGVLRRIAQEEGSPLSKSLENAPSDPTVLGPIQDAMRSFSSDAMVEMEQAKGRIIFRADDDRRTELSFYKNTLMNLVVPRSLVSNALLALGGRSTMDELRGHALFLSRLFKVEFIYMVGAPFEVLFTGTVDKLIRAGLVLRQDEELRVAPERHSQPELEFLADLMRDYLESYLVAAETLEDIALGGALDKKGFTKMALENGRAAFLAGRIGTPEALSRPTLENALTYFVDQGFLVERDRKFHLGPAGQDAASRVALSREIRRYVTRAVA